MKKKKKAIEKPVRPLQTYQAVINNKKEVVQASSQEEAEIYFLEIKDGKRNRS